MDISEILINFAHEFPAAMWRLLWSLGALVGLVFAGSAILRMSRAARIPGQAPVSLGDVLPIVLVGALLLNLKVVIDRAWNSLAAGSVNYGPISYAQAAEFGKFADAINAVLSLVSVAGGCYFFKGVVLLKRASMQGQSGQYADDSVWQAITHMLGGCLLVQIPETIERFRQSAHLFW